MKRLASKSSGTLFGARIFKVNKKKLLFIVALLLLAWPVGKAVHFLGYYAVFSFLDFCGAEEFERRRSLDGRFIAKSYIYDCGATARSTWRVALASSDDPEDFEDVFGGDVRGPVRVQWVGPATLSVKAGAAYRRDDRKIYLREDEWSAVQILFVNMDLPSRPEQP